MKSIQMVKNYIQQIPLGDPFNIASLAGLASYNNIRQILSRMVKSGDITRVGRGIYVKPQLNRFIGKTMPSTQEVLDLVAKTSGAEIAIHGAEATRLLGLSTQMQLKPIYYTTGNNRTIMMGKLEIQLRHISPRKMVNPGTIEGLVISALWYMGKQSLNQNIITKIYHFLTPEDFAKVLGLRYRMPSWMANAFYQYQKGLENNVR